MNGRADCERVVTTVLRGIVDDSWCGAPSDQGIVTAKNNHIRNIVGPSDRGDGAF